MIGDTLWLLTELLVLFLAVTFLVNLVQRRFGPTQVRRWMGGRPLTAALKGIAVGFITPFCTFSAIPMLVGLRQAGVPAAGYVAFLTAAPVLDPVLFGALVIIVGLQAASIYAAVAFVSALGLALMAQRVGIDHLVCDVGEWSTSSQADDPVDLGVSSCALRVGVGVTTGVDEPGPSEQVGGHSPVGDESWSGWQVESRSAARSSVRILRSIGLLLVVGVLLGLAIEILVEPDDVAALTGGNAAWSIPVAAAVGTPLYTSTSLFVPIANSLQRAGVGIGAIVALTISGAGANIPEFVILTKLAAKGLIAAFIGYVFLVALIGGLVAQILVG